MKNPGVSWEEKKEEPRVNLYSRFTNLCCRIYNPGLLFSNQCPLIAKQCKTGDMDLEFKGMVYKTYAWICKSRLQIYTLLFFSPQLTQGLGP